MEVFFKTKNSSKNRSSISFQAFAKKAGYASKSYPAEVLSGKKRLKLQSVEKFSNGMRLNQELSDFFRTLVMIDLVNHGEIGLPTLEFLKKRNLKIAEKLLKRFQRIQSADSHKGLQKVLLKKNFPEVFASMGSAKSGANINDLCLRTGLSEFEIRNIVKDLQEAEIIVHVEDRYYLKNGNLDLKFLKSDEFFKKNFTRSSEKALKRLPLQMESKKSLYMTQTYSVQSHMLPELKVQLEEMILKFADESEFANGDVVAEICLSFTTSK
ncbi:MAG: hypothetical protein IPM97_02425 [Bdellovibrionaceae bacterium]|nr:hypothetical protein [Pseudobdellovibrionaceae bacterium]